MTVASRILLVSAFHDYRTSKRASIHQLAGALARNGHAVTFLSTRFSWLSRRKGDSRLFLWEKSNQLEMFEAVRCFLWRTAFHPFASDVKILNLFMGLLFPFYANLPSRAVDDLVMDADYIIVESSVAAIMLRRLRKLNPNAKIIYYATDRLDTVGAHPFVARRLKRDARFVDHVCVRSSKMAPEFSWAAGRLYRAEFGVDAADFDSIGASPYSPTEIPAVSVGSMLFDAEFFQEMAPAFPDIAFHVIGCGVKFDAPPNVIIHNEMPFRETLPYIKYAKIGIAPYRDAPGVEYLADTSLKLAQYECLALACVCPSFAATGFPTRFGYERSSFDSMFNAMKSALNANKTAPRTFPTWDEVASRVLNPRASDKIVM